MEKEEILPKIKEIIGFYPQIKLVYLFGSSVGGKTGPLSDVDLAFYVDERGRKKLFDIKFELMDKISRKLKTDKIDIVILNLTESPELKYNIIKEGALLYSQEPFKVLIEPQILNEYFDFYAILKKYELTKA